MLLGVTLQPGDVLRPCVAACSTMQHGVGAAALLLLLLRVAVAVARTPNDDPSSVASRFSQQATQHAIFFPPDQYGAALLHQAMWEANAAFPGTHNYSAFQSSVLDRCPLAVALVVELYFTAVPHKNCVRDGTMLLLCW